MSEVRHAARTTGKTEALIGARQSTTAQVRRQGSHLLPWRVGRPLDRERFASIRRRMVLECCKWDPQVGDVSTLAPFPLILRRPVWAQLAAWAEALAAELVASEAELARRPELHARLGLPWRIRRVLRRHLQAAQAAPAARVIRFDFHWTTEGWRISEANSDVPGGFTESSSFTSLMAEHYPGAAPAGNPAAKLIDAVARSAGQKGAVALLTAPGYMEDQQVVAYLARLLRRRGTAAHTCHPRHLRFRNGRAEFRCDFAGGPIAAIIRFYQAEWLTRLGSTCGWQHLISGGVTPATNPGTAVLTETKRFPLVWDALATHPSTWRRLLPETRDPRAAPWVSDDEWVLKAAFCNTGDEVAIRSLTPGRQWNAAARAARWNPGRWVAQRRFQPLTVATPMGLVYPCLGVYTIDGKAAGIYGRISPAKVIDYTATDVAVLVDNEEEP